MTVGITVWAKNARHSRKESTNRTQPVLRPPPLSLGKFSDTKKAAATKLPPLQTPKQALRRIQEQLKKLGDPTKPAVTDAGQQQKQEPSQPQENPKRGLNLLADLEMEIGLEENRWQEMRRDFSRASTPTAASSPDTEPSSTAPDRMLSTVASAEPAGRDASTLDFDRLGDQFSSPSDLEKWALGGEEKPGSIQAAGPASSTSLDLSSPDVHPDISSSGESLGHQSPDAEPQPLGPPPSLDNLKRPVTRKSLEPLGIESPMLRSTPLTPTDTQPAERPRTIRPPRRSKRMSSLPDIVEDPKPLVGKQSILGLFQFPCGEKSDSASVTPTGQMQIATAMSMMGPGMPPVFSTLDAQVRTLQSQSYPSSFFDDYDDSDGDDYGTSSDDNGRGGDDDFDDDDSFDESTLWEIANLLHSPKPSSQGSPALEDEKEPIHESPLGVGCHNASVRSSASRDSDPQAQPFPAAPIAESSSPESSPQACLWNGNTGRVATKGSIGLPQPEKRTWDAYLTRRPGDVRAPLRASRPASLASDTLADSVGQAHCDLAPVSIRLVAVSYHAVGRTIKGRRIC